MIYSLFRLRSAHGIVGYMKVFAHGQTEYSTDLMWWSSLPIEFKAKDHNCGMCDRNNRPLFELDVVTLKRRSTAPKILGVIQFNNIEQSFVLIDIDTQDEYELFDDHGACFHKSQFKFVGFSFE